MPNIEGFVTAFKRFELKSKEHLEYIVLPSDYLSEPFINYYNRVGDFIKNVSSYVSQKTLDNLGGIYTELYLSLSNDSDQVKKILQGLITNYELTNGILNQILEFDETTKIYRQDFSDISGLARKIFRLIKEINVEEKERQNTLETIRLTVLDSLNTQNEKLREEATQTLNKLKERVLNVTSKEFSELAEKSKIDAGEIENLRKRMEFEIEEIKTRYKDDLSNFELIKQELIFTKAADWNKINSYVWGGILILLLIILAICCYSFLGSCWKDSCEIFATYSKEPKEFLRTLFYTDLAKNILIRLFLLSMLVLLIKYAMKHINALMHNYTINTHKANSLAAAMRIFASITNESTRELVMETASKEIFTQQKTGYLTKEDGKLDFNIIEKLSSILKKG